MRRRRQNLFHGTKTSAKLHFNFAPFLFFLFRLSKFRGFPKIKKHHVLLCEICCSIIKLSVQHKFERGFVKPFSFFGKLCFHNSSTDIGCSFPFQPGQEKNGNWEITTSIMLLMFGSAVLIITWQRGSVIYWK